MKIILPNGVVPLVFKKMPEEEKIEEDINEPFEIRDMRSKEKFMIDDIFLNGYARILGTNALSVYCSLCRHANKKQKAWPSQAKIAEELALSEPTVNEWIKVLEFFKIIKKQRIGKQCTNRYWLLDKKTWRNDWGVILNSLSSGDIKQFKDTTKTVLVHGLNSLSSNSKETQKKGNTKERIASPAAIALHKDFIELKDFYIIGYKTKIKNEDPVWGWGQCEKLARPHLAKLGLPRLKVLLNAYFASDDKLFKENAWSFSCFLSTKILHRLNATN